VSRAVDLIAESARRRTLFERGGSHPSSKQSSIRAEAIAPYHVCGIPIWPLTASQAADRIVSSALDGRPFETHLCNAFTLSLISDDRELADALQRADLNLPDGAPVAWLGRRVGVRGPVRGSTLVTEVATRGRDRGLRHFLCGGAPGVADAMAARLQARVPGTLVVGTLSPPFKALTEKDLDDLALEINEAQAQVIWIGLGTPRQDYAVPELARRCDAAVVPIGAAFNFWAGTVREAPAALQGHGLEWTYRLAAEPRRLWRRYLIGGPRFARLAWKRRRVGQLR